MSFGRHTIESCQEHESMVRVRYRSNECKSENLELYESFWRHKSESCRVLESLVRVRLRVVEVYKRKFGVG